jgi:hypothetical protein
MVLKNVFAAVIGTMMWGGLAIADEYRPDEFLGLDLSKAALSPKPLGPPSRFAPVQVEAKTDLGNEARSVRVERVGHPKVRAAHVLARAQLTRRYKNLLNAQAFDTRIAVWPCRAGGICNWKSQF